MTRIIKVGVGFSSNIRPDPQTLAFFFFKKKEGKSRKKTRVFLFAEPLKSLEKEGKTHKKARKIGKQKKQVNRKKQGLEGQGVQLLPEN